MKRAESEIWLARRAAAGHGKDEREVLGLTGPVMLRVIKRVLGADADDVEDVLQEACVSLLPALRAFRGECTLRHYGGRIAARHAIRARRRRDAGCAVKKSCDRFWEVATTGRGRRNARS